MEIALQKNDTEIWKAIPNFEGLYEASNFGRVRSLQENKRGLCKVRKLPKILSYTVGDRRYGRVSLWKEGFKKGYLVHRLVLFTFVGEPPSPLMQASHLDGNIENNALSNLKWATIKENHAHKKLHGTYQIGTKNSFSKLNEDQVTEILRLDQTGVKSIELARMFDVCYKTIREIVNRKYWQHVQVPNYKELETENARLREALEKIASENAIDIECWSLARKALEGK